MLQHDQLDAMLSPIGTALDSWDLPGCDGDPPPRPLAFLEEAAGEMQRRQMEAEYAEIAGELPAVIAEATTLVLSLPPGREQERAAWVQAELARVAYVVGHRLGFVDLARVALARMAEAAARSGDPSQAAVERWNRAQLLSDAARPDRGLDLVGQALRDLDDDGKSATKATIGALHLKGATLTGKLGDHRTANEWISKAESIAKQTGETRHHALVFGPTNTGIHAVAAMVDADRPAEALKRAERIMIPAGFPAGRVGHLLVDRARAEAWTARPDAAFATLQVARDTAPQWTRYSASVHETVATLLRARRRAPDPLTEYAEWCGV